MLQRFNRQGKGLASVIILVSILFSIVFSVNVGASASSAGYSNALLNFAYNPSHAKDVPDGTNYYYVENDRAKAVICTTTAGNNGIGTFEKGFIGDFVNKGSNTEILDWTQFVLTDTMTSSWDYSNPNKRLALNTISVMNETSVVATGQWNYNTSIKATATYSMVTDAPILKIDVKLQNTGTSRFNGYLMYQIDPDASGTEYTYIPGKGWNSGLVTSGWTDNYIYAGANVSSSLPAYGIAWDPTTPTGVCSNGFNASVWFNAGLIGGQTKTITFYFIVDSTASTGNSFDNVASWAYTIHKTRTISQLGGYNLFYGDLHSHTGYSDGQLTPADAFLQAKNSKQADFLAVTDHSSSLTSTEWTNTRNAADTYTDSNFVCIASYEQTQSWGHMNTFNTATYYNGGTKNAYYDYLCTQPGSLSMWNHPSTYSSPAEFNGFDYYTAANDNVINLIEVRNSTESGYDDIPCYQRALDKGWHVAPTADSDTHSADWISGFDLRTVVLTTGSLTRSNIYDAILNMRVYASEDRNLKVCYKVNGSIMGSILAKPSQFNISVLAEDPDTNDVNDMIKKVEVFTNNSSTPVTIYNCSTYSVNWTTTITSSTSKYYFVKITNAEGKVAVTAPVWTGMGGPTPTPGPTPSVTPTPTPSGGIISGATYKIISKKSGKALDVPGSSTTDGTGLIQYTYSGGNNQLWVVTDLGGGYYKIINKNSNKAVDVPGSSTADAIQLIQYTYSGGNSQQWQIVSVSGGYYKVVNRNSGKAMDVNGGSTADNATVIQYTYSGSDNQLWSFTQVP